MTHLNDFNAIRTSILIIFVCLNLPFSILLHDDLKFYKYSNKYRFFLIRVLIFLLLISLLEIKEDKRRKMAFQCNVCSIIFSHQEELNFHMEIAHTQNVSILLLSYYFLQKIVPKFINPYAVSFYNVCCSSFL